MCGGSGPVGEQGGWDRKDIWGRGVGVSVRIDTLVVKGALA